MRGRGRRDEKKQDGVRMMKSTHKHTHTDALSLSLSLSNTRTLCLCVQVRIGDTRGFTPYLGGGFLKQVKEPRTTTFRPLSQCIPQPSNLYAPGCPCVSVSVSESVCLSVSVDKWMVMDVKDALLLIAQRLTSPGFCCCCASVLCAFWFRAAAAAAALPSKGEWGCD